MAAKKPKPGPRSAYRTAMCDTVRKLCRLGATDIEVADFLDVDVRTIHRWKKDHEEFRLALAEAKAEADERVKESLYHRAVGYSFDAVKIFMPAGAKAAVKVPYREHVPPDTTACIFWLKNRDRANWRDKQDFEHTGKDGGPIIPVLNVYTNSDDRPSPAPKAINGTRLNGH